jgi:hypothetical protein
MMSLHWSTYACIWKVDNNRSFIVQYCNPFLSNIVYERIFYNRTLYIFIIDHELWFLMISWDAWNLHFFCVIAYFTYNIVFVVISACVVRNYAPFCSTGLPKLLLLAPTWSLCRRCSSSAACHYIDVLFPCRVAPWHHEDALALPRQCSKYVHLLDSLFYFQEIRDWARDLWWRCG